MLGMFHLLPFIKGWEYKTHRALRTVVRGADPLEVVRLSETGWIFAITELTDDCYGQVIIEYQGAEMETKRGVFFPEGFWAAPRAFAQDPAGWVQRYYRPNPLSTAGIYYVGALSSGFQGSLFPYVPSIVVKLNLAEQSTQASASIAAAAAVVAITNRKAFLVSLRKILGIKGKIDPKLLEPGPVALEEEL